MIYVGIFLADGAEHPSTQKTFQIVAKAPDLATADLIFRKKVKEVWSASDSLRLAPRIWPRAVLAIDDTLAAEGAILFNVSTQKEGTVDDIFEILPAQDSPFSVTLFQDEGSGGDSKEIPEVPLYAELPDDSPRMAWVLTPTRDDV